MFNFQISIDFESLFSNKTDNFYMNWTKLNDILPLYINSNLKDVRLKTLWIEARLNWIKVSAYNLL